MWVEKKYGAFLLFHHLQEKIQDIPAHQGIQVGGGLIQDDQFGMMA